MVVEAGVEAEARPKPSSRANYPGSRAAGRTRRDLPRRQRAHEDISDTTPAPLPGGRASGDAGVKARQTGYEGATTAPPPSGPTDRPVAAMALLAAAPAAPEARLGKPSVAAAGPATPRRVLSASGRAVLGTLDASPELPLLTDSNDVHGVLVLGGKEAGKTSLILSLAAAVNGAYPTSRAVKDKRETMPLNGQTYEIPAREVRAVDGTAREMRVLLTDTPPCGTGSEEQPLCTRVSPNSTQRQQVMPSWMKAALRSGNQPHYAVLFCIDSTAAPLWEDTGRCRDLSRLLFAMRRSSYTVVIAVTKLLQAREEALREKNMGVAGGMDPRNSYESFAGRYVEKVSAAIQAAGGEQHLPVDPGRQPFPLPNMTIFDVPTWSGAVVYKSWLGKVATVELPNLRYATSQLKRVLDALSLRSCHLP